MSSRAHCLHPFSCRCFSLSLYTLTTLVTKLYQYPIFRTPEDLFDARTAPRGSLSSLSKPREIIYFGKVKRQAWIPSGPLFASLLYFARREQSSIKIPPHLASRTRSEASRIGGEGPCVEDIQHFDVHCRTHLANFPMIDVGTLISNPSEGLILGQTSFKPGILNGPWQGSYIVWPFFPLHLKLIITYG